MPQSSPRGPVSQLLNYQQALTTASSANAVSISFVVSWPSWLRSNSLNVKDSCSSEGCAKPSSSDTCSPTGWKR